LIAERCKEINTIETKKTSMIERLQVMEALWDSLLDEESKIESPQWYQDILEERKKKKDPETLGSVGCKAQATARC
jgi:hypothetical protein